MVWIVVAYATANAAIENVMGQTYRGANAEGVRDADALGA
jgi:hypothetical protein